MKTWTMLGWLLRSLLVVAVLAFVIPGCEDEPDMDDTDDTDSSLDSDSLDSNLPSDPEGRALTISPTEGTITFVGQTIGFTGRGGQTPYTWRVSSASAGRATSDGYSQCTYTASQVAPNTVIVKDSLGHVATATLTTGDELMISPTSVTLEEDGDVAVFSASGGSPPYTWEVRYGSLGSLNDDEGTSVVYTREDAGDNAVKVTDSVGNSASAAISQPDE